MKRKLKAKKILAKLKVEFPVVSCALNHKNALELLVATMLSAQCTDKRVNMTTKTLFKKYKNASEYAHTDQSVLVEDIKSINLRNNKSKHIIETARLLLEKYNGEVPGSIEKLLILPGVGRKTANVVLGQWFRIPNGFVVDTHVKRCANRMGLTDSKDEKIIERDLMNLFPKDEWIDTATRIIFHGRTTCPARRHVGESCSLEDLCVV